MAPNDATAIDDLETQAEVDDEFDGLTDLESKLDYLLDADREFYDARAAEFAEAGREYQMEAEVTK